MPVTECQLNHLLFVILLELLIGENAEVRLIKLDKGLETRQKIKTKDLNARAHFSKPVIELHCGRNIDKVEALLCRFGHKALISKQLQVDIYFCVQ